MSMFILVYDILATTHTISSISSSYFLFFAKFWWRLLQAYTTTAIMYVPNKYAVIKRTGNKKKVLHLWIWIRESPKWWLLMIVNGWASQLIRNLNAAIFYAEENDFELVIHGVVYAEQVSRREVHQSGAWGELLKQLLYFKKAHNGSGYVASGDKLCVMTTEYLRLGEFVDEVNVMIDMIETIAVNGINVCVIALKEFDLNRHRCLEAWRDLEDKLRALAENASNRNPGKLVEINPRKQKERDDVEDDAREIEKHLREHNSLSEAYQQNIKFYRPKKVSVDKKDGIEKLTKSFIEAQKQIGTCDELNQQKVEEAVSLMTGNVYGNGNIEILESTAGGFDVAMYFRSSTSIGDKVSIELEDGGTFDLPLEQFANNMAMLRQLHRQGEEIRVCVFYDYKRSRDSLCNPEFAQFLHGVCHQQFSSAIVTQWNRISTHLAAFDVVEHICRTRGTNLLFSEEIGQEQREIAIAESNRRALQRQFVEEFKRTMNEIRDDENDETKKQISLRYLKIANRNCSKNEKDELINLLRDNGLNDEFIKELCEAGALALDEDSLQSEDQ